MLRKSAILALTLLVSAGLCLAEAPGQSVAEATLARTPQAPQAYLPAPAVDGSAKGAIYVDNMDGANDTVALKARGYLPYYRGTGPQGTIATWFQGNSSVFPAYNGPADGYVAANFNVVTGMNNIDSWLVLPAVPGGIRQGDTLYFYSRSPTGSSWPDSIRVMYSVSDTVPEGSWIELGRFKTVTSGSWELRGFEAPITAAKGRFAIRYCVIDGGPSGNNSNYIGIDAISIVTHQDSTETFGSTASNYSGAPRMRGNFFKCDANTIVKEYRWYLNPADTANIWFTIYEGDSAGGTYNRIFSRMVRTPDTIAGWYTTGPMDARMQAGRYYFYCMMWDASVSVTYYRGTAIYPYPVSFGSLVGLCGLAAYTSNSPIIPPQDTLEVPAGAFSGDMAYYQSLVTVPEVLPSVSPDSLYFKNYHNMTYLMASPKAASPAPVNSTPMAWQYNQTVPCMDPGGHYVYEIYGGNLRKFSVYDGSYTDFALSTGSASVCATDGINLYAASGNSVYKYSMTGAYVSTTTIDISCNNYTFSLVNDTIWVGTGIPMSPPTLYGYPSSQFTGGSISYAATWDLVSGSYLPMNMAFDGTDYFCVWGGTSSNSFQWFGLDRSLDSVGTVSFDARGVMCKRNPFTGVAGGPGEQAASRLMLSPNYPNPFRGSTNIAFQLPKAGRASLKVYNVLGQAVATLVDGNLPAGPHRTTWNAKGVANGIYLYRLEANGQRITRKLAVVK